MGIFINTMIYLHCVILTSYNHCIVLFVLYYLRTCLPTLLYSVLLFSLLVCCFTLCPASSLPIPFRPFQPQSRIEVEPVASLSVSPIPSNGSLVSKLLSSLCLASLSLLPLGIISIFHKQPDTDHRPLAASTSHTIVTELTTLIWPCLNQTRTYYIKAHAFSVLHNNTT